jgi:GST-like protein
MAAVSLRRWPVGAHLIGFHVARALVGFDDFRNVARMLDAFLTRPAGVRGLEIPRRP